MRRSLATTIFMPTLVKIPFLWIPVTSASDLIAPTTSLAFKFLLSITAISYTYIRQNYSFGKFGNVANLGS
jgi:hypothetical protein